MKRVRAFSMLSLVVLLIFSSCISPQSNKMQQDEKSQDSQVSKETSGVKKDQEVNKDRDIGGESGKVSTKNEKIENNGGHFVRVGDRIYFRKIHQEQMGQIFEGAVYAEGTDQPVKSDFGYVTREDKTFVPVVKDMDMFGKIFYMNGKFYLEKKSDGANYIYQMDKDGKKSVVLAEGFLDGVYPKSNLYLTHDYSAEAFIYQDDKIVKKVKMGEAQVIFEKIIDQYAIYTVYFYGQTHQEVRFYALNLDELGDLVDLGNIEPRSDAEEGVGSAHVDEIKKMGDKIYAMVRYVSGNGMHPMGYEIFSMSYDRENSLQSEAKVSARESEENFVDFAPFMGIVDGKVDFCLMGEGDFLANYDGVFYNQTGKPSDEIISHRISAPIEYISDYMGKSYVPEIVEKVGDEVYYVFDKRRYYIDGGTHFSYFKLMNMEYFCYDTKTKKNTSLFGVMENPHPQYAYVWVNEDQEDQHRLMYKQVDLAFSEEEKELFSAFYFDEGVDFANARVFESYVIPQKAMISPMLEYYIEGDSNSEGFKEFYRSMRYRGISRDFSSPGHEENLPTIRENQGGIVLVKLYFDSVTDEIKKLVEVDLK